MGIHRKRNNKHIYYFRSFPLVMVIFQSIEFFRQCSQSGDCITSSEGTFKMQIPGLHAGDFKSKFLG